MLSNTLSIANFAKTALIAMTIFLVSSLSTSAKAEDITRLATSLCEAAKTDNRTLMRKKLKSAKIRLRAIYAAISCGSKGSLLRTATHADAINAATFIATKIGKKNLKTTEGDGKNIKQWTEELVSAGDASKQPFAELYASKM